MKFLTSSDVDAGALDEFDALIVPVYKDGSAPASLPAETRRLAEWVARESGDPRLYVAATHLREAGDAALRLIVVAAGSRDEYDVERARHVVSAGVRALWRSTTGRLAVALDIAALPADVATGAAVEGVIFAMWRPEAHRTKEEDRRLPPLTEVMLVGGTDGDDVVERSQIVGEAVNWARRVANEPANLMTPTALAEEATTLAGEAGLTCEVLSEDDAARIGMNSFLSVARGSDEPARLIVLRHHGRTGDGYDAAFVGKGITFDSGGLSLKGGENMHLMKFDMCGAAAVIAAGAAVARLRLPLNLLCVAPCTENLPGGHATKPGDIITSLSGKTVEVLNTDAEGRLVLIDGVAYAQREGATRIVDVATLTGAIGVALGPWYAGLFGRPAAFVEQIREAAAGAGERLWHMPLSDEHRAEMESEIADLRNIGSNRYGGASKGAAFIEAGVDDKVDWAHLDIASTAWLDEDRRFAPKGPQGAAVRSLVALARNLAAG
jgi:leucyl aminopeptidase